MVLFSYRSKVHSVFSAYVLQNQLDHVVQLPDEVLLPLLRYGQDSGINDRSTPRSYHCFLHSLHLYNSHLRYIPDSVPDIWLLLLILHSYLQFLLFQELSMLLLPVSLVVLTLRMPPFRCGLHLSPSVLSALV